MTEIVSFNHIFYNVFGYVRTVPDGFESNKRLNHMSVSLISGVQMTRHDNGDDLYVILLSSRSAIRRDERDDYCRIDDLRLSPAPIIHGRACTRDRQVIVRANLT